ncbi:MAG: cytochrome c oxidase subunit II [Cyclobacteriaceae bacterium]|nr:cytochrome c oxidase subunit II [Cyclobacteriaceae bacterium HetDA_MAG_MS6]
MLNLVIVVAVVLILAILITIFRVSTLVGIVRGNTTKQVSPANKIQASLMIVFLVLGIIGFFYFSFGGLDESYVQPLASEHGAVTDRLFWITMAITCFVFIVTQILLFGFSYKYQHREDRKAFYYPHNNTLEYIWTGIPAVVLALLIISGWKAWVDITQKAPDDSEVIEVLGYQYSWAVRYGGADGKIGDYDYKKTDASNVAGMDLTDRSTHDDFFGRELHVPKGKPVLLNIRARDVIHSVYSPHFRLQMNAVPGMPTRFWFVPTKSTADLRIETGNPDFNFELVCNKICGKGHFGMKYIIVVDEPEDYAKWYAEQEPWLKQNPEYLSEVPADLRDAAMIAAGIETIPAAQAVDNLVVRNSR